MPEVKLTPRSREDRVLAEVRPRSIIDDIPAAEVPPEFWTDMSGFYMRRGYAQRMGGESQLFADPTFDPVNLINIQEGANNYWLGMGEAGVFVVDQAGTYTDITPLVYTGPVQSKDCTSSIINGFPIQSFRQDPPTFWDLNTSNVAAPLPGWPASTVCGSIRSFKQFLFAMNMTEGGNEFGDKLRWSNAAEPGTVPTEWVAAADNEAGDTTLGATPGTIVDGLALRGQFIVYKNHSTYTCNFVGGTFVFNFRKLFTTSGMLSRNCVAEAEGQHVVMTDGDIILHDGQNLRSLVDRKLRRFIFLQLDSDNFQNCFVFNYRATKEVWLCFPEQGHTDANIAVVWDYGHDLLSVRPLVDTWSCGASGSILSTIQALDWDSQTETWDDSAGSWNRAQFSGAFERVLAGVRDSEVDQKGRLIFVDDTNSQVDGVTPVGGTITRESLDFGSPEALKYVRRVWPRIEGTTGTIVRIRVGQQSDPTSGILWSAIQDFEVNVDEFLNFDISGRYLSFRFEENTAPGSPTQNIWAVVGFDVEWTFQGDF
jgi:hypothetical protein